MCDSSALKMLAFSALVLVSLVREMHCADVGCTPVQRQCVSETLEEIDELDSVLNDGNVCEIVTLAFLRVTGCMKGCVGVDLSEASAMCLEWAREVKQSGISCKIDCDSVSLDINSYNSDVPDIGIALDELDPWPAASFNRNFYEIPFQMSNESEMMVQSSLELPQNSFAPVEIGNGLIAVASPQQIIAVDSDGSAVWTLTLDQGAYVGSPAVSADGFLFVGDSLGFLYKVDVLNGVVLSKWNLGGAGVSGSPALAGDYLYYVTSGSSTVSAILHKIALVPEALNAWRRPICEHDSLRYDSVDQGISVTQNGLILVACKWQGYVDAFDGATGLEQWSTVASSDSDESRPRLIGPPIIKDENHVIISTSTGVVCLDPTQGDVLWTSSLGARPVNSVAVDESNDQVYVLIETGVLIELDSSNGIESRRVSLPEVPVQGPIIDSEKNVIASSGSNIVVIDASSNLETTFQMNTDQAAIAAPILIDGKIALVTGNSLRTVQLQDFVQGTISPVGTITNAPTSERGATDSPVVTTSAPTSRPTRNSDKSPPESQKHDESWPYAAVATVSTLGILDAILAIIALGIYCKKRKDKLDDRKSSMESEPGKSTTFDEEDDSYNSKAKTQSSSTKSQGVENGPDLSSIAAA